jgi:hypothetical protein
LSFYRSFGKMKQKRKLLKHGSMQDMYGKNIVVEYYLKGRRKFSQLNQKYFFPG